jgi:hypothetical protein
LRRVGHWLQGINQLSSKYTGLVAQGLERAAHNRLVVGSNPTEPTNEVVFHITGGSTIKGRTIFNIKYY